MDYTAILQDMRDQGTIITLDKARERLADTEPLESYAIPFGAGLQFQVGAGWHQASEQEPTSVYLDTPAGRRLQLTKQAMLEAAARPGCPREFGQRVRASDMQAMLNFFYTEGMGDGEVKLLIQGRPGEELDLVRAVAKGTIIPFSNLELLNSVVEGAREYLGADQEVLVDGMHLNHDLELTNLRLVFPGATRVITGTREEQDTWSTGIQFQNSQIGVKNTRVDGYLFRYWCANGSTDTLVSAGALKRRSISSADDAYEWARQSVEDVLGGLEHTLDQVQALTEIKLSGSADEISKVLDDLYARHRVPVREQRSITAAVAGLDGDITMYDIMQAVTQTANREGVSPRIISGLMALGGHVTHGGARCGPEAPCGRLLPEGWDVAPAEGGAAILAS